MEIFFILLLWLLCLLYWKLAAAGGLVSNKSGVIFAFVKFVFLEPFLIIHVCLLYNVVYCVFHLCEGALLDRWLTDMLLLYRPFILIFLLLYAFQILYTSYRRRPLLLQCSLTVIACIFGGCMCGYVRTQAKMWDVSGELVLKAQ